MIIIRYSEWDAQLEGWKEKLVELVTAHRFEPDESATIPSLQEKEKIIQGEEAITAFLKQLEKDINDWRTPRCGV
ncbi:MAG: hypothetical protein KDD19_15120 [Phaeodactylibacter sp.]|nr:hypothetical protein [Phaeodactylibacter sp.]MCB9048614.1 hypothetical protein [Lewinellaceae bacterium]